MPYICIYTHEWYRFMPTIHQKLLKINKKNTSQKEKVTKNVISHFTREDIPKVSKYNKSGSKKQS